MKTSRWITQPLYKATLKDLENWNKTHKVSEKVHFINAKIVQVIINTIKLKIYFPPNI